MSEFEFQALHKVSLRDSVCTLRVCDVLLQLLSTLIDIGLLVKKQPHAFETTTSNGNKNAKQPLPGKSAEDGEKTTSSKTMTVHNIAMDLVIRWVYEYITVSKIIVYEHIELDELWL